MDIKTATILLIIFSLIILFLKKKISLLECMVFLLPFKSINFDFVLTIWGYYIPLILLMIWLFLFKGEKLKFSKSVLPFLVYITLSSIIISTFFIDQWMENDYFESYFRGRGRYISSLIRIIFFDFGLLLVIHSMTISIKELKQLLKVYLNALILISILGLIQVIIFSVVGLDLFPMSINNDGSARTAISDVILSNLPFLRVNSLGGEPKGLGATMAVAIGFVYFLRKSDLLSKQKFRVLSLLFTTILILTLSSGGFGLLFVFVILSLLIKLVQKSTYRGIKKRTFILIPLVITLGILSWNVVYRIIDSRILSRSKELLSEEADSAIQTFFSKEPNWLVFGSGTGNIHHLAHPYIPEQTIYYLKGNIFVSRYGYMKIISENGFVGLILFLLMFFAIFIRLRKIKIPKYKSYSKFFFGVNLMVLLFFLARANYVLSEMMFLTGCSLAFLSIVRKDKRATIIEEERELRLD